jgi:predicted DNA-binding ribbon-helix-helix protein
MRTKDPRGKSLIVIKHVRLGDHQASVCLEEAFWLALKEIAAAQDSSMARLIRKIDSERRERLHKNLSSAVRLFILDHYRNRCGLVRPEPKAFGTVPPPAI